MMDKFIRKIDELGRVVIPVDMRNALDLIERTEVEIWLDSENKQVIVQKGRPSCTFCASGEKLMAYHGKRICAVCRAAITTQ